MTHGVMANEYISHERAHGTLVTRGRRTQDSGREQGQDRAEHRAWVRARQGRAWLTQGVSKGKTGQSIAHSGRG